ncbi:hypothetical protein PCASD_08530 [Puccinia coronata f. sp. avenae]|uniref:Uncharacterized protein n=1 Tax=Puccinia coronata f. sp. avenae TaxID=200324 RepID=A0A2N5UR70_9BASI|nr:hypothetical protein PCASD_08530 [Puccinia coronata f. sp. avenae]
MIWAFLPLSLSSQPRRLAFGVLILILVTVCSLDGRLRLPPSAGNSLTISTPSRGLLRSSLATASVTCPPAGPSWPNSSGHACPGLTASQTRQSNL